MTTYEVFINEKSWMSELISTRSNAVTMEKKAFTFATGGTFSTAHDCTYM